MSSVSVGSIASILNGYAFKSKEYVDKGIRVIRITNVQKGEILDDNPKFVALDRKDEFSRYILENGDILISLTGNVGRVGVIDESMLPAALNQRVGALKIHSQNVHPIYLFHLLNSDLFERDAIKNSKGIAQLNLSSKWIEQYKIPLPPLDEQKRIAGILDAADELRSKRRQTLLELNTLIQSTFLDMFGDPLDNPKGWQVKRLSELSTNILNGTTPKGGKQVYIESGVTFFRSQNVWRNQIKYEDVAYIDQDIHHSMKKSSLLNKDILISKTGRINTENSSLGRAALFEGEDHSANINGHVYLIRLSESNIHKYVLYILASKRFREHIRNVSVGAIDKRQLNKGHIEEFPIIFPPIEEQRKFADIVERIEAQKARCQAHLDELDTLFASLQSRAFKGEL